MSLAKELEARGFIQQHTAQSVAALLDGESRVIYHGIDPTADSAHAGNFVNWMLLRHLAQAGHRIVFLVGGGTGMIGDPKPDAERVLTPQSEVADRVVKLRAQAERIMGGEVTFVNNYDWLGALDLIGFLRDIGKHFTVNELIKKDAIASRLLGEQGLSYTEFAYPLLQAYDYLMLYRSHGVTLQVGGSDQWGNMVAGVDLIRRLERAEVHALTVPLITDKTTGRKFGKSEGNAVWLDAEKTSPYQFYQFWFNVADENVIDYLKLFTTIPMREIADFEQGLLSDPGARVAQRCLARSVTSFVHGEAVCAQVERVSATLFGEVAIAELSSEEQALLRANAPVVAVPEGSSLIDALVEAGLAQSKREARTFIESGAISLSGQRVDGVDRVLMRGVDGELVHVRRGKKQIALLAIS
jgi:tyrosyl-tRNA synthetase